MPSPPADLHRPTLAARWAAWPASRRLAALALLLTAVIVATYSAVGGHKFVNLDDDAYVEFQPMVNQGVRPAALAWAFGGAHSGQWHPLTTLTHILDCEIFGVNPGPTLTPLPPT